MKSLQEELHNKGRSQAFAKRALPPPASAHSLCHPQAVSHSPIRFYAVLSAVLSNALQAVRVAGDVGAQYRGRRRARPPKRERASSAQIRDPGHLPATSHSYAPIHLKSYLI